MPGEPSLMQSCGESGSLGIHWEMVLVSLECSFRLRVIRQTRKPLSVSHGASKQGLRPNLGQQRRVTRVMCFTGVIRRGPFRLRRAPAPLPIATPTRTLHSSLALSSLLRIGLVPTPGAAQEGPCERMWRRGLELLQFDAARHRIYPLLRSEKHRTPRLP
jgi:hypothetical protein